MPHRVRITVQNSQVFGEAEVHDFGIRLRVADIAEVRVTGVDAPELGQRQDVWVDAEAVDVMFHGRNTSAMF